MPLEKRIVQIDVGGGLEQKPGSQLVSPGQWADLNNMEWLKAGVVQVRLGFSGFGNSVMAPGVNSANTLSASSVSNGLAIANIAGSLCMIDDERLFAYDNQSNSWIYQDHVPTTTVTRRQVASSPSLAYWSRSAVAGDNDCHAWWEPDPSASNQYRLRFKMSSRVTRITLRDEFVPSVTTTSDNVVPVEMMSTGNYAVVMYKTLGNTIAASQFDFVNEPSNGAWTSYNVATDAVSKPFSAYAESDAASPVTGVGVATVFAYANTANIAVKRYTLGAVLQTENNISEANTVTAISISGLANAGGNSVVSYCASNNANVIAIATGFYPGNLAATHAKFPITLLNTSNGNWTPMGIGTVRIDNTRQAATFSAYNIATNPYTASSAMYVCNQSAVTANTGSINYWLVPISVPFHVSERNKYYVWAAQSLPQGDQASIVGASSVRGKNLLGVSTYLVELETAPDPVYGQAKQARVVAMCAPRLADGLSVLIASEYGLARVRSIGGGQYGVSVGYSLPNATGISTGDKTSVIDLVAHFTDRQVSVASVGGRTFLGGGVVTESFGGKVFETASLMTPFVCNAANNAGTTLTAGTYQYGMTYEQKTPRGDLRSSDVYRFYVNSTTPFNLAVTPVPETISLISDRERPANGATTQTLYRSVVNGATLYRLTVQSVVPMIAGAPNDKDSITGRIVDNSTDAAVVSGALYPNLSGAALYTSNVALNVLPVLYTTGGVLPRYSPGVSHYMMASAGRLWSIGDDRNTIWYSSFVQDGETPWFNEVMTTQFPGGDCVALADLNGKRIALGIDSLWVMLGDVSTDVGTGATLDWSNISSTVGCSEPASVLSCSDGVFFLSSQGFYLLDQGLSVNYIGASVEDVTATYSECLSVAIHPTKTQIRWCLRQPGTSNGVVLVYDEFFKQWSKFFYTDRTIVSATEHNDRFWMLSNQGVTLREELSNSSTAFLDAQSTNIRANATTAWVKTAGITGFQRLYRVMAGLEKVSNSTINIALGFDYNSSFRTPKSWNSATFSNVAVGLPMYPEQHVANQRCTSFRIKIDLLANSASYTQGNGGMAKLFSLSAQVGVKGGMLKQSSTYRK